MSLFRGYVPTKNKKCLMKFKNVTTEQLLSFDEAINLPEFAGILDESTILIDVDDFNQSEILMNIVEDNQLKCRVYETSRGKHFLFKNSIVTSCKTKTKLACGISADIKLGSRNSYSILKYNNKEREIIYDKFENEDYDILPYWLLPIKTSMEFLNMEEGDGRNQTLFNYILTLQSNDFSVKEAKHTLEIINKYVLKNPLSDKELNVILRDDSFKKPVFFKGTTFLFDKFATYIKNNHNIIKLNNQLHIYKDGIYVEGSDEIESEMIKHIPNLNRAKRSEVLSYLDLLVRENSIPSSANLIAFKNGIYDLTDDTFNEFSTDKIITNKIDWDYDPTAYSEITDKTMNKISCEDSQIRTLLEEVIGYMFYRRNELRKAFILVGDKSNGKSTFLDMIKTLLGDKNTSALDLNELGDRFKTAELFGKLANIGDDIGDEFIPNPAIFKKVVSGDRINAERKGKDPFDFNNYSKMLFSANNIPRIKDKTGAVLDRLVIIPFNASFSPDDPDYDPYIKYKLRENISIQYLINIGLKGLKRVLDNKNFTVSQKVQNELQEYAETNNPVLLFFKDVSEIDIVNNPTKEVYQKYQEFCIANNFQPMANVEFSKQVKRHFDLDIVDKKLNGKKYRIFKQKKED